MCTPTGPTILGQAEPLIIVVLLLCFVCSLKLHSFTRNWVFATKLTCSQEGSEWWTVMCFYNRAMRCGLIMLMIDKHRVVLYVTGSSATQVHHWVSPCMGGGSMAACLSAGEAQVDHNRSIQRDAMALCFHKLVFFVCLTGAQQLQQRWHRRVQRRIETTSPFLKVIDIFKNNILQ